MKTLTGNKSIFPFIQVTSHLVMHIHFIDNINNIATKAENEHASLNLLFLVYLLLIFSITV